MTEVSNPFLLKLQQKRDEIAAKEAKAAVNIFTQYADCIPDIDLTPAPALSEQEQNLDEFMKRIKITDAYTRWGGRSPVTSTHRKEIKVSCPNPQHTDKDPSFSMNTQTDVFNCFKCGGGDIYDLAAWHYGYPVPGYKDKMYFRDLKAHMAEDFGYVVITGIAGDEIVVQASPGPEPQQTPDQAAQAPISEELPEPEELSEDQQIEANRKHASIDWKSIIPEGTFARAYLDQATQDDCPEEFHFWSSLMAVGMATGLSRQLVDQPRVTANLFICYTGPSGGGKSKAKGLLTRLLRSALPYKPEDVIPLGTSILKNLASGEVLIKMLQHDPIDPITNKPTGTLMPVRALVDFEELSDFTSRSGRTGSTLKGQIMDLYTCQPTADSNSLANRIYAVMPFVSVATTTQPKVIRDLISNSDNNSGFMNRWVFATGVEKPEEAINKVQVDMTRAEGLLRLINGDSSSLKVIDYEPDAEEAWTNFFRETVSPYKKSDKDGEISKRVDLLLKKLMLIFAINERLNHVTKSIVERVTSLFSYLTESYEIIDTQVKATETGDQEDYILKTIKRLTKGTDGPTAGKIFLAVRRKVPDSGVLRKVLEALVATGRLEEYGKPPGPSGGRPTKVYKVTP